jgi:ABC-type thiamine transport system ATPase subunit
MSKIRETILTIIAEIAEERGLTLVLFKHQVIVFDQSLDLTQVVLEHLDESLPEIDHILSQIENLEQVSQTSSQ